MNELIKLFLSLIVFVAGIAGFFAWYLDRPDATTWGFRLVAPPLAILALGLILVLHLRRDEVPDYLRQKGNTYFSQNGFSFLVDVLS